MLNQDQIPSDIARIIERKRLALEEEKRQKEEADRRSLEEAELQGKIKFNEYLGNALLKVPEWMRQYLDMTIDEPDYVRIANKWDRVENISLFFSIPGLANIEFHPKNTNWRCEVSGWNRNYDDTEPYIHFGNDSYWNVDVEFVLGRAEVEMRDYKALLTEYAAEQEVRTRQQEENVRKKQEHEAEQSVADLRNELARQQEKAEEQILLDAIKNDSVALAFLKAFVMIVQERSGFMAQIEDTNNSLYSMEEYWSGRAAELHRQADNAQRHAEEERNRLQGDLDEAETRLKKTTRGW